MVEPAQDKLKLLSNYAIKEQQWMCRGIYTSPETVDRQIGRPDSFKSADTRPAPAELATLVPSDGEQLRAYADRQNDKGSPLVGFRSYPRSDFACFHRLAFAYFIGTMSNRTAPPQAGGNGDDMKGQRWRHGDDGHFLAAYDRQGWAGLYTMDQCFARGSAIVGDDSHIDGTVMVGSSRKENTRWVWHAGFVYMPIGLPMQAKVDRRTGTWKSVDLGYSDAPVHVEVFQADIANTQAGGFVIAPCQNTGRAIGMVTHPSWRVLHNDDHVMAVGFNNGDIAITFFDAGELPASIETAAVKVNRPCLLLRSGGTWRASDPSQQGGSLTLSTGGESLTVTLPKNGTGVVVR